MSNTKLALVSLLFFVSGGALAQGECPATAIPEGAGSFFLEGEAGKADPVTRIVSFIGRHYRICSDPASGGLIEIILKVKRNDLEGGFTWKPVPAHHFTLRAGNCADVDTGHGAITEIWSRAGTAAVCGWYSDLQK